MRVRRNNTLFLGLVLFAALTALPAFDGWSMGSRVPTVGMQAEDFSLTDLEGKPQSLSQYRGKIVLVNFWATWCKPCTTEMPAMQSSFDKLRDKGFVVLAINELEDDAKVREHIKQYGHTFPVLMDRDNKVANQFGVFRLAGECVHRSRGARAGIHQGWPAHRAKDRRRGRENSETRTGESRVAPITTYEECDSTTGRWGIGSMARPAERCRVPAADSPCCPTCAS